MGSALILPQFVSAFLVSPHFFQEGNQMMDEASLRSLSPCEQIVLDPVPSLLKSSLVNCPLDSPNNGSTEGAHICL